MGFIFEHIAEIIRMVHDKSRIGFCLDTCHTFSAGYDLRTKDAYEKTMNEVDRIIGFRFLREHTLTIPKLLWGAGWTDITR